MITSTAQTYYACTHDQLIDQLIGGLWSGQDNLLGNATFHQSCVNYHVIVTRQSGQELIINCQSHKKCLVSFKSTPPLSQFK